MKLLLLLALLTIACAPATASQQVNTAPSQAAKPSEVRLTRAGTGSHSTEVFRVSQDWDIDWSFDCSNYGAPGYLGVMIHEKDGSLSLRNTMLNQAGASGKGVEHYHTGGEYYLTVNALCSWELRVLD